MKRGIRRTRIHAPRGMGPGLPRRPAAAPVQALSQDVAQDGRRILSYAVFQMRDDDERALGLYHRSVPAVLRAALTLFPGWTIVIHHDDSLLRHPYSYVLAGAEQAGLLRLRHLPRTTEVCRGMFWRMRPIWFEEGAEIVACRDVDALPLARDRAALEAFVASDAAAHCLLDHVAHAGLMGGLAAYRVSAMRELFPSWDGFCSMGKVPWEHHGADQDFLNNVVGSRLNSRMLTHRINDVPTFELPIGEITDVSRDVLLAADTLAPYAGVSGFNVENACEFYDAQAATKLLRQIEAEVGWRWRR